MTKPMISSLFNDDELEYNRVAKLTVLSFGAGQDSTTLLYKIIYDKEFRNKYVPNDLLVLMSNTGNEHDETYEHIQEIKSICLEHNIEFVLIEKEMGFHGNGWGSLTEQFERNSRICSKAFPSTCTDRLKIKPLYNFLEHYISKKYSLPYGKKKAYRHFAMLYGKIDVIIGIAKGEESRVSKGEFAEVWKNLSVRHVYPLIDEGMDRQSCQDYIRSLGHKVPMPSNCMFCHWLSLQELLWLYKFRRPEFDNWVVHEQNKINSDIDKGKEKNLGVWGQWNKEEKRALTLLDKVKEAQDLYGHWSDEQLHEYKWSHGHCVSSKY